MRLIDADKLKAHYAWWGRVDNNDDYVQAKTAFDTIVDLQPTYEVRGAAIASGWKLLNWACEGIECDIPWEYDGKWIIVTDGEQVSVERIKKDAIDHFFPSGRWFDLEEVKAWMPMPMYGVTK